MSEESNHKSYVRQFGQRPRVDSELGVLPNIVSCTTYGLKGTMSEAELHMMRSRLRGGLLAKAKRGELKVPLPVGLVYDPLGQVVLDPDEQVQHSLRLLFAARQSR